MGTPTLNSIPFKSPEDLREYVVFDLETTGLYPKTCQIIQLAAVHFVDHHEVDRFSTYIDPRCPIPTDITQLTGISDETVAGAPHIEDVFMDFVRFLRTAPFVTGWNVSFDLDFLSAAIEQDISTYLHPFDTMLLYGRVAGRPHSRLSDACAEIGKIIAAFSGTDMELPVLMALWMGMRMSEIRGARFEDISEGRLHICRAIVSGENGDEVKPPKTFSGDRWVSVPAHIQALIDATGRSEGYIVPTSGQTIYNRFIRGLDAAGIPRCRFHDLRHANAAIMVRLGVESRYAQERNGWSDDWMYKQVYAYTMDDRMAEIDKSIDDYFDNKMATEVCKK